MKPTALSALPRTVWLLGCVSLLNDTASELVYPLIPVYLAGVLAADSRALGVIEGVALAFSSFMQLLSGWLSDRRRSAKPWVVAGYALAAAARPLYALAGAWPVVLALRLADRLGKGLRSAPRDAMLAAAAPHDQRGLAFGLHRAMDNLGAVIGPLLAFAMLESGVELRQVFLWTALPGALAVLLAATVREQPSSAPHPSHTLGTGAASQPLLPQGEGWDEGVKRPRPLDLSLTPTLSLGEREPESTGSEAHFGARAALGSHPKGEEHKTAPIRLRWSPLPPLFRRYLLAVALFTLGYPSNLFLLLKAREAGIADAQLPLLWGMVALVDCLFSTTLSGLSDRLGRQRLITAGWLAYAAVLAVLGFTDLPAWGLWPLFAAFGLFFAATEGTEKALVADLAGAGQRGTAFGFFHLVSGLMLLPASILFGWLWHAFGAHAAFGFSAGCALLAAALLRLWVFRSA
ncbi:MFS transporter [Methylogaea oryzae]|uniref:MFS transporter n=1 Tax=Methylogaea oryzae TaxID=1295382 RepID=A0A8D4VS82_9GAMM|nr:MFS transporter [Methylogaea oryzae]BBL71410.1 MFS transporter [Methylogaea oryzae]